ncbi:MAG TPA: hypothetical protein VHI52_17235, partial [Verrucomicrobiae bacterium]|nr:hypothetical protein [Verrucomicrobiae bacterium]
LEFPDRPHSASNPFTYRYAYMVIPASQTLDINYIHNQANNPAKTAFDPGGRDFLRNQGVGTWEINLGAFLYDLNTNTYAWGGIYSYTPPVAGLPTPLYVSRGNAFFDAFTILSNRYGGTLNSQSPIAGAFGLYVNGGSAFALDGMDGYSAGPVMTTSWRPTQDPDILPVNRTLRPWPGADNTNHLFSSQDLFTRFRGTDDFPTRLQAVGLRTNTYDRYTFYRLLSQLGSDSAPEPANKINLNYDNLVRTNALGISSSTNFAPWRPMDFFTNAANTLLANAGYNFTITNIQVYPTNYYTASVHRMLQLAVNIYDSTTNRMFAGAGGRADPYCPTVLRPLFRRTTIGTNTVVMIVGYREVFGTALASSTTGPRIVELDNVNFATNLTQIPPISTPAQGNERLEPLISGMPLVIGAKKGFPNFNEFASQTFVYVSRLLEFRRQNNDVNAPVSQTNEMYVVTLTNTFGLEAWNSYSNAYPRSLQLVAAADITPVLTSIDSTKNPPVVNLLNKRVTRGTVMNITPGSWSGWQSLSQVQNSFVL